MMILYAVFGILLLFNCSETIFGMARNRKTIINENDKEKVDVEETKYVYARKSSKVWSFGRELQMFAVRGHGKSGTNWIRNLLNLHPNINCVGEMNIEVEPTFRSLFPISIEKNNIEAIKPMQWFFQQYTRGIEEGGKDVYARTLIQATKEMAVANKKFDFKTGDMQKAITHIGEHSPQTIGFPFIKDLPTIYIVRDGRDVVVSWAFHLLNMCIRNNEDKELCDLYQSANDNTTKARLQQKFEIHKNRPQYFVENPQMLFSVDNDGDDSFWVEDLAQSWQRFCDSHKKNHKGNLTSLNIHSKKKQNNDDEKKSSEKNILIVFYENLQRNTIDEVNNVYEYLNVDPQLAKIPSVETRTLPGKFKNKGNSFYRKGVAGAWKEYATETFIKSFKRVAQDGLELYGYEKDSTWTGAE